MYAFVGHESACQSLRQLSVLPGGVENIARWPRSARPLPIWGECVSNQRDFKRLAKEVDLAALGLSESPVDLLVPLQSMRSPGKSARFHVWGVPVPAGSFLRPQPQVLVSSPELVVIQLCSAQGRLDPLLEAHVEAVRTELEVAAITGSNEPPVLDGPLEWERIRRLVAAVVVACEFAGTYRLGTADGGATYDAPRLMGMESLRALCDALGPTQGVRRARRASELAFDGAASPMETAVALMLTLPVEFGGFGLPKPLLNSKIDVSGEKGLLSEGFSVTPDMLWPERMVALEYDSSQFHAKVGKSQLGRDATRANALTALGWRVFRATPTTVGTLEGTALLARQLAHAMGCELVEPTPVQRLRRSKLYMQLMPKAKED